MPVKKKKGKKMDFSFMNFKIPKTTDGKIPKTTGEKKSSKKNWL